MEFILDDPISSFPLDSATIEAIIYFAISLPCVVFFALGNRTLSDFGVIRARRMVEDGHKAFEPFVKNAESFFMALNIMEMISVIVMIALGHSVLSHWLMPWANWTIIAVLYLFFDLIFVRFFGRADERRMASRYVKFMRPICVVLTPMTWFFSHILKPFRKAEEPQFANADRIEEELEIMVDESTRQGGLQTLQGQLITSAIDFGDTTVREVMIPRTDLTLCAINTTLNDAMRLCVSEGYSRLPVYEEDADTIVGLLYSKDLMKRMYELENDPDKRHSETVQSLVRNVRFVPETKKIQDLFKEFQREHCHMAIVIDEFGGTAGIVTLEDILEEFFGEIQDEYDSEESAIVPVEGKANTVKVDARTNVSEIAEFFDVEFEENTDFDTVGGLVTYELGRMGAVGDTIDVSGLRFSVLEANEKCVLKVEVSCQPKVEPTKDE